jgi:hypothetical protein
MSHDKDAALVPSRDSLRPGTAGAVSVPPVRVDEVYTLAEFQQRTRMSRSAVRSARRRGLRVTQCGKRCYVAGADWVAFLAHLG